MVTNDFHLKSHYKYVCFCFPDDSAVQQGEEETCDLGELEEDWKVHSRCQCACHHVRAEKDGEKWDLTDQHPSDFALPLSGEKQECSLKQDANFYEVCRCWC